MPPKKRKKAPAKKRPPKKLPAKKRLAKKAAAPRRAIDPEQRKAVDYLIEVSRNPELQAAWRPMDLDGIRAAMRGYGLSPDTIAILTSLNPQRIGEFIGDAMSGRCFIAVVLV